MKKKKIWKGLIKKLYTSGYSFVTVSPFAPISGNNIIERSDAGPLEILELFKNAAYVFTDTFHGMSFSIHMRKSFCLLEARAIDDRKADVLSMLGLESRVCYSIDKASQLFQEAIEYKAIENILEEQRQISLEFLRDSIKEICYSEGNM